MGTIMCEMLYHQAPRTSLQEVKHHPASVDLELVKRLAAHSKANTLSQFLRREFSSISSDYAGEHVCCVLRFLATSIPGSQITSRRRDKNECDPQS